MRVLVTGATGFIGNYVVQELLKHKHTVIATSASLQKAQIKDWFNKVSFMPLDFSNYADINLFKYFEEPEILIHLAWQGLPNYNNNFHIFENLPMQKRFLSNLIGNGLKNMTIAGTCLEYGMQEGALVETMECKPSNAYAISKNELRIYLMQLKEVNNFILKWTRLFYMYGKGQSSTSLFSQLDLALENGDEIFNMSGGEQIRDFLSIEEVAKSIVDIALQNKVEGIINVCSGSPSTIKELVEKYIKVQNKKISLNLGFYPYPDFEPFKFWGDNKKLKSIKET